MKCYRCDTEDNFYITKTIRYHDCKIEENKLKVKASSYTPENYQIICGNCDTEYHYNVDVEWG